MSTAPTALAIGFSGGQAGTSRIHAFPSWCGRISKSCAIYIGDRCIQFSDGRSQRDCGAGSKSSCDQHQILSWRSRAVAGWSHGTGDFAHLDPPQRIKLLSQRLERFTERTITDKKRLERELNRCRAQGYAFTEGERLPNTSSVAAPVFGSGQKDLRNLSGWRSFRKVHA